MDPMTDLFLAAHVESTAASWGLSRMPPPVSSQHVYAHFVYVVRGNCDVSLAERAAPMPLTGGDCVLLAPSTAHTLRDSGGAPSTVISGWYAFDRTASRSLVDLLPPLIMLPADQARSQALKTTLDALVSEIMSPGPGSSVVVMRLADVLFIQALRAYVEGGGCTERPQWLRALADAQIGKSLRAMHDAVERPWTLATLASAAGMSRSAFAPRFKVLLGETPLEYLTRWRMQTAGRLLRDGRLKMNAVAAAVGYQAEGAFMRAFRRVHGVSPSEYRRSLCGAEHVNGAGGVVGNEEAATRVDRDVDRTAPVAAGIRPPRHQVGRSRAGSRR
jgi:AraC-like DNA-binding protein